MKILEFTKTLLQNRNIERNSDQLRVLCSAPSYPQISNSYIHAEIVALQHLGVHVEVWSARNPTSPSNEATAPVHRGTINAAIRKVSPHIIYGHWLNRKEKVSIAARKYGIPIVLRGHSYEFSIEIIRAMDKEPTIRAIYLFPEQMAKTRLISDKVREMNVCYNNQQYKLYPQKDSRTVVRAAVARPEQDLDLFIRVASRLPDFRFILIACNGYKQESYLESLLKLNQDLGGPAEILINQQYSQVAPIVEKAAICLHTMASIKKYGMPILISEAMATGCYVLTPNREGAKEYIGNAGSTYENEDQVVQLISETAGWDKQRWQQIQNISSTRALDNFSADRVMEPIVHEWRALANLTPIPPIQTSLP